MREARLQHNETSPELTGGDVDASWEDAYAVGDEAPGGDNPTPDQDRVDDIGKALGLPHGELERLARVSDGWNAKRVAEELRLVPGFENRAHSPRWRAFAELTHEIAGLPRHISQHPGGMVISTRPLVELVPVQPAAMAGRQVVQWDKDSCDDARFINEWLDDWSANFADRQAYADELRVNPGAEFLESVKGESSQMSKVLDKFAKDNEMGSCITSDDVG